MGREVINCSDVFMRGLFMVDSNSDKCECDFCDDKKQCAHINGVGHNVIIICKDCLENFAKEIK